MPEKRHWRREREGREEEEERTRRRPRHSPPRRRRRDAGREARRQSGSCEGRPAARPPLSGRTAGPGAGDRPAPEGLWGLTEEVPELTTRLAATQKQGHLTSRIAPRDARRAVIFAPSRGHLGEGQLSGPGRDARSAIIFTPLGVPLESMLQCVRRGHTLAAVGRLKQMHKHTFSSAALQQ